jgi:hypothetical protein
MRRAAGIGKRAWSAARPAAWLAFLAAGIQALLPLLIAFELNYMVPSSAAAATMPCHESGDHPADHQPAGDPAAAPVHHAGAHHEDDGTQQTPLKGHGHHCPLCITLHAGQALLAPIDISLKAPAVEPRVLIAVDGDSLTVRPLAAGYSPRAPPPIG